MSADQAKALVGRFVVCNDPKKPSLKGPRLLTKLTKRGLCVLDYIHHVAPKYVEEMPK